MCGIVGVFNLDGKPFLLDNLRKMSDKIAHRGPDGEGYYVKDNFALAHRRLAILDTSELGTQPMSSEAGNWIVSFNGCIYNFLELKQDLIAKGHRFVSNTDTEVIVEGLEEYGIDFIEKFNGMFAIAAWNTQEQALYLSRDRYGVKPLYYWFDGKKIVFASEIKAIAAHPEFKTALNYEALNEYFSFQNMFSYQNLFKGVVLLPQANTVRVDAQSSFVKHHSWWDYDFTQPDTTMSFEEAKEETERLFQNAVTRQMISDVPVGSYLSGGMDSGSITAIASQHVSRLQTFTCGFDMSEVVGIEANYDERLDAELMASYFKTEHYEQVLNSEDIKHSLPDLVYHLEDLRVGMSYPNYTISRLASKFVKVALQGTGGDELFGGYPWRYYRVFESLNQKDFFSNYYGFWQRLVEDHNKSKLFSPEVMGQVDVTAPKQVFENVFTFNKKLKYDTPENHIQNSLYFEIKTFLHGLLLVGDKLSMAHGLEERFPFLDNDLVDFAQKIPVRHKLGNLSREIQRINENTYGRERKKYQSYDDGKNVLRKAMQDFIPKKIINRKKQGFSAPDESWYRTNNIDYIENLLLSKHTLSCEYLNRDFIKKIVDEHVHKKMNHRLLLWSLMNFEWWCRMFLA